MSDCRGLYGCITCGYMECCCMDKGKFKGTVIGYPVEGKNAKILVPSEKLKAQEAALKIMRDALEFYSFKDAISKSTVKRIESLDGGEKAREALRKAEEILK